MTNTIDVFISNLRRKLEEGGEPRILHTKRGAGYVLKAVMADARTRRAAGASARGVAGALAAAAVTGGTHAGDPRHLRASIIGRLAQDRIQDDFNDELRDSAGQIATQIRDRERDRRRPAAPPARTWNDRDGRRRRDPASCGPGGQVAAEPRRTRLGPPEPGIAEHGDLEVATAPVITSAIGEPQRFVQYARDTEGSTRRSPGSGSSSPRASLGGTALAALAGLRRRRAARCARSRT